MDHSKAISSGFRIHYFRDLANPGTVDLRIVRMDASVPMVTKEECPACNEKMKVFCTLIAGGDRRRMRIGRCPSCGSMGYIERPTESWIAGYYLNDWDNARGRDVESEARMHVHGVTKEQFDAVNLARGFRIEKERPVCDIGCGKGNTLKEFERLGFRNLLGIEPSAYRVHMAHAIYGYEVLVGDFENEEVVSTLKARSPIGIFFSHHVLEHVYRPYDFLKQASSLQQEGDYIILSMPDVIHEPAVITLFWLPHLNGFTACGLERLINRCGYEVIADNFGYRRLMMAGRRARVPRARGTYTVGLARTDADRMREWFFTSALTPEKRHRIIWTSKSYRLSKEPVSLSRAADRLLQFFERSYDYIAARAFGKFRNQRSLVVSALKRRFTDARESPLEIQFDGDIELLVR